MPSSSIPPLSIAIVGGGVAGLATAIGIIKNSPHLKPTLYEAAESFGNIGGGISFGPNAIQAMSLISPAIMEAFDKISTKNQVESKRDTWFEFIWGMEVEHKTGRSKVGELIDAIECPHGQATAHRATFLDQLIRMVPRDTVVFEKRLAGIEEPEHLKVKLRFTDGTEAMHDAVVGCDGIKSMVRRFIAPEASPQFSSKYCHRGVIPMDKAIAALGEVRAKTNSVYLGKKGHIVTFPIEAGNSISGKFALSPAL